MHFYLKKLKRFFVQYWVFLALIILICINLLIRLNYISNYNFPFWYDQARDATHAREIISGDLKIMGPSASGTLDTIYHGVIFYYFLASIYSLSLDPQIAINVLALLTSLSLLIVFIFATKILSSAKLALIPVVFLTFSTTNITFGNWLSNPALTFFFLPSYWLFCWQFLQKPNLKNALFATIAVGCIVQATFYGIYWLGLLLAIFCHHLYTKHLSYRRFFFIGFSSVLIFALTISTMIVTEFLMVKRGILSPETIANFTNHDFSNTYSQLEIILATLIEKIGFSLIPHATALSVVLFSGIIFYFYYQLKSSSSLSHTFCFFILLLPSLFFLFYFRQSPQIIAGLEIIIYILLTLALIPLLRRFFPKKLTRYLIFSLFLLCYVTSNMITLNKIKTNNPDYYGYYGTSILREQLKLIDYTYHAANYQPFSISALTSPYGINVTWSYLYSWYGQEKYNYLPQFFGPNQEGIVGGNLLTAASTPLPTHFTIYEPVEHLLPSVFIDEFTLEQNAHCGTPSAHLNFGNTLKLATYH
jgi:hypothetical protein